jgi:hypothetical protein
VEHFSHHQIFNKRIWPTDVSIAAGCDTIADRSQGVDNHPSRSGRDDCTERRCERRFRMLSSDQVW